MELRHLRYFVAVAEEKNITHAAERLNVSQPPLSRQIRDLEEELGVKLLDRGARAVSLTPAGVVFFDEAKAVLQRAESAIRAARATAAAEIKELHIGYAPSPTVEILPPALRSFQTASPGIRVVLHDMTSSEMTTGMRTRALQLAIMVRPPRQLAKGLKFEPLRSYRTGVLLPHGHRLSRQTSVSAKDLANEPLVVYDQKEYAEYHEWAAELLGTTVRKLKIAEQCDGALSLISAVEAGRGVAFVVESVQCITGSRVQFLPVHPAPEPLDVGILSRTTVDDEAAQLFLKHIRANSKQANQVKPSRKRS